MKNHWPTAALLFAFACSATAQGPLAPPGAPAPSMKTLQQVEPRTPIGSLPFAITQPGSYYVTTNLTGTAGSDGITITTDNVTIDLGGFALTGLTNSFTGVALSGPVRRNITVGNGAVRNWGLSGVDLLDGDNVRVYNVLSYTNGGVGIHVGLNAVVENCTALGNGSDGMRCFEIGQFRDCVSSFNRGAGFRLGASSSLRASTADSCGSNGIMATVRAVITDCAAHRNGLNGIEVGSECAVERNACSDNGQLGGGADIRATGARNVIRGNHLTLSPRGLHVTGTDNRIEDNFVIEHSTANYTFVTNNQLNLVLSELPETLDWPCVARLAGDLHGSVGLIVNANDVTLDLGGFSLIGGNGGSGIAVPDNVVNLCVRNGTVRDWVGEGVDANRADNSRFDDLRLYRNGGDGLQAGRHAVVTHCMASFNTGDGLQVDEGSTVSDCTAFENTGSGIDVSHGSVVHDCAARNNHRDGIRGGGGMLLRDCTASGNSSNGIGVFATSQVLNNVCDQNGRAGIVVTGERNRIDGNHATLNDYGVRVTGVANLIVRNTASGNGTLDYSIGANNSFGTAVVTGPFTNLNPWVNFMY